MLSLRPKQAPMLASNSHTTVGAPSYLWTKLVARTNQSLWEDMRATYEQVKGAPYVPPIFIYNTKGRLVSVE